MRAIDLIANAARRSLFGRHARIFYAREYRLALTTLESRRGAEPRRADLVRWYLLESGSATPAHFVRPEPVTYEAIARVHDRALIDGLHTPEGLARVFAADPPEIIVDEIWRTIRLATGGTLAAARDALRTTGMMMNLLGGFHHAGPSTAGGFCPVNDIAIAVAQLRLDGFLGKVGIIDTDAHPPDGLSAAFLTDARVWIGSLSGSEWNVMPNVDETLLPKDCDDETYLRALDGLIRRMPAVQLCFVLAGGDVLKGDRLGLLGLSLDGTARRDRRLIDALGGVPSVWLPGGGYHDDAWKVLAQTAQLITTRALTPIPPDYDPLHSHFEHIATTLTTTQLQGDAWFTEDDLDGLGGGRGKRVMRLLGFYTPEGLEFGFSQYGILRHVERLGYSQLRITIEPASSGDCMRLLGTANGVEHVLIECVVERREVGGEPVLFVNWMALRHPRASFSPNRPQLPGQDVPGLGMAREAGEMLRTMASRLGLKAVVFRPAHYHVAHVSRRSFAFVEPRRQGRFLALVRDLEGMPLLDATAAVNQGRVRMNGEVYRWEAEDMAYWLEGNPVPPDEVKDELLRVRFTVEPPAP